MDQLVAAKLVFASVVAAKLVAARLVTASLVVARGSDPARVRRVKPRSEFAAKYLPGD